MHTEITTQLKRCICPERAGVRSDSVKQYIDFLIKEQLNWHSVMFINNSCVAAEAHKFPYGSNVQHCMFSISKNITSLALGFAVTENIISLNDAVADFFPDYNYADDKNLRRLKVRHLASMCSGKMPDDLKRKTCDDWIKQFFDLKWEAMPGKLFHYVNENVFMISEILHRATGQCMTDFLMPRLFEPLAIKKPYWETDINGTEAGGWGLYLTPDDFAKIFLCIKQNGVFDGKQVIPDAWLKEAILNQAELYKDPGPCKKQGYGYSFWRKKKDIYGGEGMYGQIAIIDEKTGLLIIITGSENDTYKYWDKYFEMRDSFVCKIQDNAPKNTELDLFLSQFYADSNMLTKTRSHLEEKINGKLFSAAILPVGQLAGFGLSIIPAASVYMSHDTGGEINDISLEFFETECIFSWSEKGKKYSVPCSLDGNYRYSDTFICGAHYTFASYAVWKNNFILEIHLRTLQSVGKRILTFDFSDFDKILVSPASEPPVERVLDSVKWVILDACKTKLQIKAANKLFDVAVKIVEPKIMLKN